MMKINCRVINFFKNRLPLNLYPYFVISQRQPEFEMFVIYFPIKIKLKIDFFYKMGSMINCVMGFASKYFFFSFFSCVGLEFANNVELFIDLFFSFFI